MSECGEVVGRLGVCATGLTAQVFGWRPGALAMCCRDTACAAAEAADAAGEIAIRTRAPSRTLATARTLARENPEPGVGHVPVMIVGGSGTAARLGGPVEARLRSKGVTSPRLLWRARTVDQAGEQVINDASADVPQRRQLPAPRPRHRQPAQHPHHRRTQQLNSSQPFTLQAPQTSRIRASSTRCLSS